MATTYEPIATITLGSATASISFASISNAYTDLRFVLTGTGSNNGYVYIRFNGDTGTNYSRTVLYSDNTAAYSDRATTQNLIDAGTLIGPTAPAVINIDLINYSGSTNKTSLITYSGDRNASGEVIRSAALWRSTAVVNSITLTRNTGNFAAGTTATLYGIKAA